MGWSTAQATDVEMNADGDISQRQLNKYLKNLISESAQVFEGLTRLSNPTTLQTACQNYRRALKKCVQDMDTDINLLEVIKASLALLHLCEIVYFSDSSALLPYAFAGWMREHYGALELEELDASFFQLQNHVTLETEPTYWPTVIQLVIAGNGRKAWELISRTVTLHGRHSQSLETIRHLLLHMPTTNSDSTFNWAAWQDATLQLLQNDPLVQSDPHIRFVVELLSGQHLEQHARSWHQLVIAQCLLEDPKAHLSAATTGQRIVHRIEAAFPTELPPFERIIVQLLQYDLTAALDHIHTLSAGEFPWFLAHLCDLLVRRRELQSNETFIIEFVKTSLIPHSLWPLAILYLEQCPSQGGPVVLKMLQDAQIDTDYKAHKLLDICATYGLVQTASSIASARGQAWQKSANYSVALTWYVRANNIRALNDLCDVILQNHADSQQLESAADVLSTFTDLSPRVAFLVRYHEVKLVLRDLAHVQETQHPKLSVVQREAATRLGALCVDDNVPNQLWISLIGETLPLLELSPPVFKSNELYGILEAIQDHQLALCSLRETQTNTGELLSTIQRAIAICLSQAVLVEI